MSRCLAEGLPLQVLRLKDLKLRNDARSHWWGQWDEALCHWRFALYYTYLHISTNIYIYISSIFFIHLLWINGFINVTISYIAEISQVQP